MHAEAEPLLVEALALRCEMFGEESAEAATSLFHLAWLRQAQGRFEESEQGYRQAIGVRERLSGPDDLQTADIRFALAWLHGERAQFESERGPRMRQAAELMQQVLQTRRKVLGDKHRQVALAHIGLSWTQFAHHNELSALASAAQALAILEAAEGRQDVPSAAFLYFQSVNARRQGDKATAMKLSRELLATLQRLLGVEHPLSAMLMGDMAGLAHEMGDQAEAERLIRHALDIGRKLPGGHPLMVEALRKLADAVRDRGELEEAEKLYQEALERGLRLLGPEHPHVRQVQQRLETLRQRQAAPDK
jgi:tetratricopeptide (TPR) repeat protein